MSTFPFRRPPRCALSPPKGCALSVASAIACLFLAGAPVPSPAQPNPPFRGLTAVDGLKVGHHTLKERPTGCTVILAEKGAVAGVDVRGGAPGSRETALLDPMASAERIHA